MTINDVAAEYERVLNMAQEGIAQARMHHSAAAAMLAVAAMAVLILGVSALRKQAPFWLPSMPVPVAVACAHLYSRSRRRGLQMARLKAFCQRAIERVQGDWAGKGATGEEFENDRHLYARELNIFGEGSLFELLCIARTGVGRRGLAGYLLNAPDREETLRRQQAIRELRFRTDLREKVALLGEFEFSDSRWETFREWLDSPPVRFENSVRFAIFITSLLLAGLAVSAMLGALPWITAARWIAPLAFFHGAVALILRRRVSITLDALGKLSGETQVIREGLQLLENERFQSEKLSRLVEGARNGADAIRRLERLLGALHECNKEWFYLPSRVLMLPAQLSVSIERWRAENSAALRGWLAAWAEFEALNALACYSYENPDHTFPELCEEGARFEAQAMGHPLLARETCVRNDVELNSGSRFYIVSGSNMSGKSTLLRAIGLNAVLARAGAPVRAAALRLSPLNVSASLSVVDSLQNGRSKFLAEIERLRAILDAAASGPVLFLVDEILGGTNSRDRRAAAEAVVRTLVARGAVGAVSTHDLALSEIAEGDGLRGVNVHMGSRGGGGPMDFDYRLKPGVTREANAIAIARMVGVPV